MPVTPSHSASQPTEATSRACPSRSRRHLSAQTFAALRNSCRWRGSKVAAALRALEARVGLVELDVRRPLLGRAVPRQAASCAERSEPAVPEQDEGQPAVDDERDADEDGQRPLRRRADAQPGAHRAHLVGEGAPELRRRAPRLLRRKRDRGRGPGARAPAVGALCGRGLHEHDLVHAEQLPVVARALPADGLARLLEVHVGRVARALARVPPPLVARVRGVEQLQQPHAEGGLAVGTPLRLRHEPRHVRTLPVAAVAQVQVDGPALVGLHVEGAEGALVRVDVPVEHQVDPRLVEHALHVPPHQSRLLHVPGVGAVERRMHHHSEPRRARAVDTCEGLDEPRVLLRARLGGCVRVERDHVHRS
mmetsp:Transcript_34325/g.85542  ORF Transcript_34325/g.85542 Transcript_34325/m.85542 type:complete len:364 (-) Transcript_34325:978-2069(-)